MNEITKLYENARIEKELVYFECNRGRSSMRCCPINSDERDEGCSSCFFRDKMKEVYEYPPFTAEKQLNIIKFLGKTRDFHTCGKYCTALNSEGDSIESLQDNFEESLAGLMNLLWQDLTSEEKKQIKEILE